MCPHILQLMRELPWVNSAKIPPQSFQHSIRRENLPRFHISKFAWLLEMFAWFLLVYLVSFFEYIDQVIFLLWNLVAIWTLIGRSYFLVLFSLLPGLSHMCMVPLIIKEPTIMATSPPTMNKKNFPMSLILATIVNSFLSNYRCLNALIRFNSEFEIFFAYV